MQWISDPNGRRMTPTDNDACIDEAAIFVARQPGAVDAIRKTHVGRPDGSCAGCGASVRWPCLLVAIVQTIPLVPHDHAG